MWVNYRVDVLKLCLSSLQDTATDEVSHLCEWLGSSPRKAYYHPNMLTNKEKIQQIGKKIIYDYARKNISLNIHILHSLIMNVWDQQNPSQKNSPDLDIHRRKLWTVNQ